MLRFAFYAVSHDDLKLIPLLETSLLRRSFHLNFEKKFDSVPSFSYNSIRLRWCRASKQFSQGGGNGEEAQGEEEGRQEEKNCQKEKEVMSL